MIASLIKNCTFVEDKKKIDTVEKWKIGGITNLIAMARGTTYFWNKQENPVWRFRFLWFISYYVREQWTWTYETASSSAWDGSELRFGEQSPSTKAWSEALLLAWGEGGAYVPEDVHSAECSETLESAERQRPLSDILRYLNQSATSPDELQTDRWHCIRVFRQA